MPHTPFFFAASLAALRRSSLYGAGSEKAQPLFVAENGELDGVMNGRTGIPLKAWKAEQIRKGVYAILREENRKEQLTHKHNLDR